MTRELALTENQDAGRHASVRWEVCLEAPYWYEDSDPNGRGPTREAARQDLFALLLEMYEGIGKILKDNGQLGERQA